MLVFFWVIALLYALPRTALLGALLLTGPAGLYQLRFCTLPEQQLKPIRQFYEFSVRASGGAGSLASGPATAPGLGAAGRADGAGTAGAAGVAGKAGTSDITLTREPTADTQKAVDALLGTPLSADAAVRIALLNNPGLQSLLAGLGASDAQRVSWHSPPIACRPPSPSWRRACARPSRP